MHQCIVFRVISLILIVFHLSFHRQLVGLLNPSELFHSMGIDKRLLPKGVRASSGQFDKHRRIWSTRNRAAAAKRRKEDILRLHLKGKPIRLSNVIESHDLSMKLLFFNFAFCYMLKFTVHSFSEYRVYEYLFVIYLLLCILAITQISTNEVRPNEGQTVSERDGGWTVDIGSDYTKSIGG